MTESKLIRLNITVSRGTTYVFFTSSHFISFTSRNQVQVRQQENQPAQFLPQKYAPWDPFIEVHLFILVAHLCMSCRTIKTKSNISRGEILRNFIKSIEGTGQFNVHARQRHPLGLLRAMCTAPRSQCLHFTWYHRILESSGTSHAMYNWPWLFEEWITLSTG